MKRFGFLLFALFLACVLFQSTHVHAQSAATGLRCNDPGEDYSLIKVNGYLLNQRTYNMLINARQLYHGQIDILDAAITQGSYTNTVSASFGTHQGGGAVDISVIEPGTWRILYEEIPSLIAALRASGFAAWLRDLEELYPGSPIHIHAIAIGDRDLSEPAQKQLTGPAGYFWGLNGLPDQYGGSAPDKHGGAVICPWMIEKGVLFGK